MREVHRSAIVPYPAEALYALVADVERYPEFLPGCTGSAVLAREPGGLVASLSLARGPFASTFTTRNTLEPPRRLTMQLVDGPFKALEGEWVITPLVGTGTAGCRIELTVRFQFAGAARDLLLGPAFEATCSGLVDAFVQRARAVYG
ncbi:MAG: type II toxin-antitoxin system RatA family toxin [Gammaproteobacteria bacterium]|nr:type II toxin-antitoxin system RatA family toxin [Gammaproteobacteria bacterium]